MGTFDGDNVIVNGEVVPEAVPAAAVSNGEVVAEAVAAANGAGESAIVDASDLAGSNVDAELVHESEPTEPNGEIAVTGEINSEAILPTSAEMNGESVHDVASDLDDLMVASFVWREIYAGLVSV